MPGKINLPSARPSPEFYRPVKRLTSVRLDADILQWLKRHGQGLPVSTRINQLLRERMTADPRS